MATEQVLQVLDSPGRIAAPASTCACCNGCGLTGCLSLCQKPVLVHAVDVEEGVNLEPAFQMPRRRTYHYSIFAARLAIMIVLAVLIGLVTILSWHFTTLYSRKAINNLAFNLRTQLLQRPNSRMWNLMNSTMDSTTTQVKLAEYVLGQHLAFGSSTTFNELSLEMKKVTWAVFASHQTVKSISIIYSNGLVQAFERGLGNTNSYYYFSLPSHTSENSSAEFYPPTLKAGGPDHGSFVLDKAVWYKENVDPNTGQGYGPIIQVSSYDAGLIGNSSFIYSGKTICSPKANEGDPFPFLSCQAPARDPSSGAIVAVVRVTSRLSAINILMEELVAVHGGYMYLTTTEGALLATSTNNPLVNNTLRGPELLTASESTDLVIRAGAEWLSAKYGDNVFLQPELHDKDVPLAGTRFYIDSSSLNLTSLPLVAFSILPHKFIMGEVDGRFHDTLQIVIPVAVCILVIGWVFILILTTGVSTEMTLRAEVIKHLDARRKAEAYSNYKSQFLANMSHELRTPMAAVIGLLDILLSDDDLSAEQLTMVSQIRRCSTALLRLLNNILDLSKVESGKLVLEETEFDLGQELEGLVDMFSGQCVDHNIEIVLDLADDIPQVVRGDSARTVQIFANLISNAIKFTSSGHIILRGRSEVASSGVTKDGVFIDNYSMVPSTFGKGKFYGGPYSQRFDRIVLWFEVDDTGCGIDPSKWESIFDSFVQADPSTTRTYGGTGLGLCIVRSLVEKMGGEIKVVRKEGPGTLVRLCLTFDRPCQEDVHLQRPHALSFPADLEQSRVLIAMKGDAGQQTLVKWMTKKRVQVCEASDWDEAIAVICKFARHEPYLRSECSTEDATAVANSETSSQHEYEKAFRRWSFRRLSGGRAEKESFPAKCTIKRGTLEDLAVPGNVDMDIFRPRTNSTPLMSLAVLDVDLLPSGLNSLKASSMMLDHFRNQGILISWILNHDTSSAVKMELRRLGYTMMVNKPLYKSKLFMLLTSMVGNQTIVVPDLDDFMSNLGPYSLHIEARDGLSPGSRMSFDLGPSSSAQTNQALLEHKSMLGTSQMLENKNSEVILTAKDLLETKKKILTDAKHRVSQILSHETSFGKTQETKAYENYRLLKSESGEWEIKPECVDCQEGSTPQEGIAKVLSGSSERSPAAAVGVLYENNMRLNYPQQFPSPSSTMKRFAIHSASKIKQDVRHVGTLRYNAGISGSSGETTLCHEPDLDEPDILAEKVKESSALSSKNGSLSPRKAVNRSELGTVLSFEEGARAIQFGMKPPLGQAKFSSTIKSHEGSPVVSRLPSKRLVVDQMGGRGVKILNQFGRRDALKGIHILLAEDTPVLQKVATIMLEKMGATVVAVGDGLQAVEALLGKPGKIEGQVMAHNHQERKQEETERTISTFNLVLMDCQMPKMDGYAATKAIRKAEERTGHRIPIVALTAHAMSSDEGKCLQVGMDAYLTKPIDCKLMVTTILFLTRDNK